MAMPFRSIIFLLALISGVITSYTVFAEEEEKYDRLDGRGESGKRVDVIEWEGNLEVHVYPKNSIKGLSAKIDDRTEGKKVMVIGYTFEGMKRPLIRRAILGIPINKNFKAFMDPTTKDYDKLAISNDNLGKPYVPYKLLPAPAQWYPDGDPRNEEEASPVPKLAGQEKKTERAPASKEREQDDDTINSDKIKNFSW